MLHVFKVTDERLVVDGSDASIKVSPGISYYVDPQNGDDDRSGRSWTKAFASFDALDDILADGDTINFRGVYKGNWTAPNVNDVTLVGVANQPRQATSDGVANGAGATWLSLASPAVDNLLKIYGQSWHIKNIFFNNSDTTKADVWLHRNESLSQDASHAIIEGCRFTGTCYGIKQSGGVSYVRLLDNFFFNFAGSGDTAIASESGTGDGTGIWWEIARNRFSDNVHSLVIPLNVADIHHNLFVAVGHVVTATSLINTTSGGHNTIHDNVFSGVVPDASPNDTLFVAGTADHYSNNQGTTAAIYGKPDEA